MWLGLKFEDEADLERARADLGERLKRIDDAERRAWLFEKLEQYETVRSLCNEM
jgi:hypothetical protein